jgi:Carbohydrate-selective porin, OprB family
MGFGAGGAGFDWQFTKRASLQGVFHTNVPGLFPSSSGPKGYNTVGVQLALTPIDPLDISIYYINSYSPNGSPLLFVGDDQLVAPDAAGAYRPLQTNAVGTTVNWQLSPKVNLGGWFGYTSSSIPGESGRVETTNYMLYANFPDLFGKGNLGGIYVGQPPKIVSSNLAAGRNYPDFLNTGLGLPGGQPGTSTHVELFYRWQMTDNISITPGVFAVFQPGHSKSSDPVVVGALRTTLTW